MSRADLLLILGVLVLIWISAIVVGFGMISDGLRELRLGHQGAAASIATGALAMVAAAMLAIVMYVVLRGELSGWVR